MFTLPLLLKCKRGFSDFLVSTFMISVVDLLSADSSSAEERVCEELWGSTALPQVLEVGVQEGFGEWGENRPPHV